MKQKIKYISEKEAAERLEVSRETMRKYVINGIIPALILRSRKGSRRTIFITRDTFEKFISSSEHK
jgi:excisionase family DNA binding protein